MMILRARRSPLLVLLLAAIVINSNVQVTECYRIAVVPKMTSPFFDQANRGCLDRVSAEAKKAAHPTYDSKNFTCVYRGTPEADAEGSIAIIEELIDDPSIDAIAVSVLDPTAYEPLINRGVEQQGKPIVTFDSDAPDSKRLAYVGTNNYAMGEELAKLLKQVKPDGGRYGILSGIGHNLEQRVAGVRSALLQSEGSGSSSAWVEVASSPKNGYEDPDICLEQMWALVKENPDLDAIVSVVGLPMYKENRTDWKHFVDSNRNVLTVVADTLPVQLDLMQELYVDALVGQLPYNMGFQSAQTLLAALEAMQREQQKQQGTSTTNFSSLLPSDTIYGTHQLEVLRIPLRLPPIDFNYNCIGNVAILGYVLCAAIASCSIGCAAWTRRYRKDPVVVSGQPVFLIMICTGTLLMGLAIVPLGIDDAYGQMAADIACMSVPWLVSVGFTVTFSALFSKTWRLNKLLLGGHNLRRIQVTEKDVMLPFVVLLSVIIVTLVFWTAIAPLRFVRTNEQGTDPWNRPIGSYGRCSTTNGARGGSLPYAIVIGATVMTALIVANVQAYRARNIKTEFSESSYIAMANASFLQAIVVCLPILFLTKENPRAYYVVLSAVLFIVPGAVLVFIFVPKIVALREALAKSRRQLKCVRVSGLSAEFSHTNIDSCYQSDVRLEPSASNDDDGDHTDNTANVATAIHEDPVQCHLQTFRAMCWSDKRAVLQTLQAEFPWCLKESAVASTQTPATMNCQHDPDRVTPHGATADTTSAGTVQGATARDADEGEERNFLVDRVAGRNSQKEEATKRRVSFDDTNEEILRRCSREDTDQEVSSRRSFNDTDQEASQGYPSTNSELKDDSSISVTAPPSESSTSIAVGVGTESQNSE